MWDDNKVMILSLESNLIVVKELFDRPGFPFNLQEYVT
jgi:hypothetical protein